ncbi:MAG TPA: DUF2505 domain-containing protein [Propionibacteriaceae bacterium]|nr:DUF2505 domain-containing protein [Propionibacteriaceae bacterium]
MDINSRLEFAAPVAQVYAMLTDQAYLEEVCVASQSVAYSASVEGHVTRTERTLHAPESAARFTGPHLVVHDETTWGPADADGSRRATVRLTVAGQPVTMNATMALAPEAARSVVTLTGNLKAAIPLLGRKIEQSAAPAVLAGFRTQQQVGNDWLVRNAG